MKNLKLPLILLTSIIALTACSENKVNISTSTPNISKPDLGLYQPMAISNEFLTGKWQLKGSPLILEFTAVDNNGGKVSVLNGCNHITASYEIVNAQLKVSSPISTRMACENRLMQIDNLATELLKGEIILEKFVDSLPKGAYLKITANQKDYKFVRVKS